MPPLATNADTSVDPVVEPFTGLPASSAIVVSAGDFEMSSTGASATAAVTTLTCTAAVDETASPPSLTLTVKAPSVPLALAAGVQNALCVASMVLFVEAS